MRRLLSSFSPLLLVVACTPPPNNNNNNNQNNNNQNNGARVCTIEEEDVQVGRPEEAASLPTGGTIDLSCIGNPTSLGPSENVVLEGCIDIFGLGGEAVRGIKVAVFDVNQNPKTDVPAHGEVDIAIQLDANGKDCGGVDANSPACRSLDCEKKGFYRLPSVPTHVPLIMKVHKPSDDRVVTTYSYDVVFDYADNSNIDGVVLYDANLIYRSTIDSIPTLAGRLVEGQEDLTDGVGRGIIAGEIHDCADKIVKGASITSNHVDVNTKITYFDGNTEDPKPDLRRLSTNTDGIYVILNTTTQAGKDVHTVNAGIVEPGCAGADCQCVSLSSRTVRTFPDSVTIVTLRGDIPTP